jgi:hypothetical protein
LTRPSIDSTTFAVCGFGASGAGVAACFAGALFAGALFTGAFVTGASVTGVASARVAVAGVVVVRVAFVDGAFVGTTSVVGVIWIGPDSTVNRGATDAAAVRSLCFLVVDAAAFFVVDAAGLFPVDGAGFLVVEGARFVGAEEDGFAASVGLAADFTGVRRTGFVRVPSPLEAVGDCSVFSGGCGSIVTPLTYQGTLPDASPAGMK